MESVTDLHFMKRKKNLDLTKWIIGLGCVIQVKENSNPSFLHNLHAQSFPPVLHQQKKKNMKWVKPIISQKIMSITSIFVK